MYSSENDNIFNVHVGKSVFFTSYRLNSQNKILGLYTVFHHSQNDGWTQ